MGSSHWYEPPACGTATTVCVNCEKLKNFGFKDPPFLPDTRAVYESIPIAFRAVISSTALSSLSANLSFSMVLIEREEPYTFT